MKTQISTLCFIACLCSLGFTQEKPPVAVDDYAATATGQTIAVNVLANDYGMEGHYLKIFNAIDKQVEFNDSLIIFTPDPGFTGERKIKYLIIDTTNGLYSGIACLFVNVCDASYGIMHQNTIDARINAHGTHFHKGVPSENGHFYVPAGSRKSTFYSLSMWTGGKDENGVLHFAGDLHRDQGCDYFAGPVSDHYDTGYQERWNKVFRISKADVEYHRDNWWIKGYSPDEIITVWPAHGDHHKESEGILAPYYDYNDNGLYDPLRGDYPLIPGDEAVFFVINDDMTFHGNTQGEKLGIEVRGMAWVYNCPQDSALHNTLFLKYEIINKSANRYSEMFAGFFADMDIGYSADDHMQTDVSRNSLIAYNGDAYDGEGLGQVNHYMHHPPAQSLTVLQGPLYDPDGIDNETNATPAGPACGQAFNGMNFGDGIIDNERMGMAYTVILKDLNGATSLPQKAEEYYNMLQGKWKDGNPVLFGGDGRQSSGVTSTACRYMYPDNSDPVNWGTFCMEPGNGFNTNGLYWNESQAGNPPGERSGIVSMGPFTLEPEEKQELAIALVFACDYQNTGNVNALQILKERISRIRYYYDNEVNPCISNPLYDEENPIESNEISVYPNPTGDYLSISGIPPGYNGNYQILDVSGRVVMEGRTCEILNVSKLAPGLYVFRVLGEKESFIQKIVKK